MIGVLPMIGEKSGVISHSPAHCRITLTSPRQGNRSSSPVLNPSAKSNVDRIEINSYGSSDAPATSSPREDWLTYKCRLADTTILFSHGFKGSVTKACNGWITNGVRSPTISVREVVQPATADSSLRVLTNPLSVCTPAISPSRTSMPVTAVF